MLINKMKRDKKDHTDFEIQFYEGVLRKKPDFVEALSALGDLYTRQGRYEKGLEIDEHLLRLRPEDPIVLYNLACSYSLLSDTDRALRTIQQAIDHGYDDFHHLEQDGDLDNLRHDRRFLEYFSRIKNQNASH